MNKIDLEDLGREINFTLNEIGGTPNTNQCPKCNKGKKCDRIRYDISDPYYCRCECHNDYVEHEEFDPDTDFISIGINCGAHKGRNFCEIWLDHYRTDDDGDFKIGEFTQITNTINDKNLNECVNKLQKAFEIYKKDLYPKTINHNGKKYILAKT